VKEFFVEHTSGAPLDSSNAGKLLKLAWKLAKLPGDISADLLRKSATTMVFIF